MAQYKLYVVDEDGWVTGVRSLQCEDDECAVHAALNSGVDEPMELWTQDRLVERFGPAPPDEDDQDTGARHHGRFRRRRAFGPIRTPARSAPPPSWARRSS
ncbi:MAG TPA: hypothetical protein VGH03_19340 [Caulobacteraceae bacterium]|jgi:hypothetical protein